MKVESVSVYLRNALGNVEELIFENANDFTTVEFGALVIVNRTQDPYSSDTRDFVIAQFPSWVGVVKNEKGITKEVE